MILSSIIKPVDLKSIQTLIAQYNKYPLNSTKGDEEDMMTLYQTPASCAVITHTVDLCDSIT